MTRKKSIEEEVDEEIEKEIEAEVDAEFKLVSKVLDDATAHRAGTSTDHITRTDDEPTGRLSPDGTEPDKFENVVLLSPGDEAGGRTVTLEAGGYGLALRDPAGALLKVIPLEHMTRYGTRPAAPGLFSLLISRDLESFFRMDFRTDDGKVRRDRAARSLCSAFFFRRGE